MHHRRNQRARAAEKALKASPNRLPQYGMLALILVAAALTAGGIT